MWVTIEGLGIGWWIIGAIIGFTIMYVQADDDFRIGTGVIGTPFFLLVVLSICHTGKFHDDGIQQKARGFTDYFKTEKALKESGAPTIWVSNNDIYLYNFDYKVGVTGMGVVDNNAPEFDELIWDALKGKNGYIGISYYYKSNDAYGNTTNDRIDFGKINASEVHRCADFDSFKRAGGFIRFLVRETGATNAVEAAVDYDLKYPDTLEIDSIDPASISAIDTAW